jgi:hypothetical protein
VNNTKFQTNLTKWQSKNRCWMVSKELPKQHLTFLPIRFCYVVPLTSREGFFWKKSLPNHGPIHRPDCELVILIKVPLKHVITICEVDQNNFRH